MKVVFLSHTASPEAPTGAERSLSLLARGMQERGHRAAVVFPGPTPEATALREAGVEVETIACRACWLTYHDPRPLAVAAAKWLRYAWPQRATAELRAFIRRWGADVVHVNCLPHLRGARAARGSGRPVVWHVREILPAGPRRRWFARALRREADAIVAVSEATAAGLRDEGLAELLQVIPNGVAVDRAPQNGSTAAARGELGLPLEGVTVGLLGQLVPHKGGMDFLQAAIRAAGIEPGLRFLLAGAGPEPFRSRLAETIEKSGQSERIHLLPPQPTGETLVRACDIVCLATRTPDPFPRAILEAMAEGKPVAAYRSGGATEMVDDGASGLLVPCGDVDALSTALVDLGRDAERRSALGREGARRAREEFSIERHLERMESLFRSMAG